MLVFFSKERNQVLSRLSSTTSPGHLKAPGTEGQSHGAEPSRHGKTTVTTLPPCHVALTFIWQAHSSIATSHTGLAGAATLQVKVDRRGAGPSAT